MTKYATLLLKYGLENLKYHKTNLVGLSSVYPKLWNKNKERPPDTDSHQIGIDNHDSDSMTNSLADFSTEPRAINFNIKGIKVHLDTTKIGTVRCVKT
jgi:hypothetical protein